MYRTEPPIAPSARALRKRLPAAALAMLCTCTAFTVAEAQAIHATPDDNVAIGITQASLAGTHAALVVVGLAPGPLGTPAEVGALSADLVLKSTPAILEIPADLALFPNAPLPGSSIPFSCVYRFAEPVLAGDSAGTLESEYEAIFFIPYNPLDDVFGDLGTPTVYHPQADIAVDVSNPYLDVGEPSGRLLLPEFPEGRHSLEWRAGTSFNYVLDAALPGVLIATFAYAEGRVAAKAVAQATKKAASHAGREAAREAAKKQADHLFTLVRLAEEAGLITAEITSAGEATDWYEATTVQTAVNEATQTLTVWDTHVPYVNDTRNAATHILTQDIVLEATDLGGVRFGRVHDELRSMFELVDDCGKLFETTTDSPSSRLLTISDTPHEIEWTARELENGPYRAGAALAPNQALDGEEITTVLVQRVLVRDTQAPILVPPPGFARYSSTPVDLTGEAFSLGLPRVVDLADPAPSVTNDAPDTLEVDRRYVVNWQATDATGNVTQPGAGTPEQYAQVVTIKSPGTNTAPAAQAKSAATLTSRPVEIELTGTDTDLLDGRVDPLAFEIEDYPVEGSFEAPLYPFFIEDFRLSPVGDQDTPDGLTRTSPLGELAGAFRLLSPSQHAAFLIDEICNQPARAPFNGVIPVDFIYQPTWIHVDDDGFYYVRDAFWVCGEPQTENGSALEPMHAIPRISRWNEAGELVAMRPLYPTVSPLYDDTNLDRNLYPRDEFSVDGEGRLWLQLWAIFGFFDQYVENYSLSPDLGEMRFQGANRYSEQDLIAGRRLLGVTGDLELGVIYELHGTGCGQFCQPGFVRKPIVVRDGTGAVDLAVQDGIVGRIALPPDHSFGGTDLRADSKGNVYVVDPEGNRIHKFSPTHRDERGEWVLGEYIGWLGSCTANLQNEAGVPFSGCDEERGISKGYACTDFTCARAADTSGSAPGQFDAPGSIVIDPRDVLYVGDVGNSRVQRFAPDGTFAGVAESTGTGVNTGEEPGFILGNFGRPEKLAVNSSSLYVFDGNADAGDYFLHVFKTLPFYDVTDASARVKYVSDFDFQGRDRFTYVVDDGIDESEPAPVDVTVTRAFRPPERLEAACFADEALAEQVPCTLAEDTSLVVRLRAYDPDGFVSTGGLDRLSFGIDEPAANGTLEPLSTEDNSATYRYTPRADYYGEDAFAFNAGDGVDTTTGGKALLTVTPVPDVATIDFGGSPIIAGRGFRRVITATYRDADGDAASNPTLLEIDWGDGLTASAPGWQRSGRLDPNGREIDPQEALDVAGGMLAASHVYLDTGDYGLSVTMANYDGDAALQDSFNETAVSVIEATKVSAVLALPVDPLAPDTAVAARIDVTNHVPEGWAGLVAGHVEISVTVPQGLTFIPLDGRCTAGAPIVCSLGDLAQGETVELPFEASVALADARVESDYVLRLELADDGPSFIETNSTSAVIGISDRDGDGTIDVDDAFADDDRYVADTDGDGLADAWELAFGYDPGVADDTSADADGDGVTLAGEFAGGSYPWLADEHGFAAGNRLETGQGDDLFGIAIAGGDFNGDGYADTVIGAPYPEGGAGAGAVYIANGSAGGAGLAFPALAAQPGQTEFGRDLAVGDFDGNGRPDLAIASANAVSVYFNNGRILAVPDLVLEGEAGRNFGIHLTAGDLDGDGADDLVVGEQTHDLVSGEWSGSVSIYASTRGGVAGDALTVTDPSILLGRSSAIGDIDGDGRGDLLLGNSAPEEVLGYLGADNDWSATDAPVVSFRLSADEPFGYGLLFGYVMASGADIGGDGIDDLVVTGWGGNPSFVHVFDSTTAYWDVATPGARSAVAPWITIDTGVTTHPEHLGFSVALAELDADGHADLVAGAIYGGGDPLDRLGEVRVFRGGDAGSGAAALGAPGVFGGTTPNGVLGYEVAVPGDVDGDGYADIAGGAPGEGTPGDVLVGHVQIWRHVFAPLDPLEDPDVDGVGEAFDNCPVAPNTDQANVDGDAAGDVCDPDADGDGFSNADDNCPLVASIDQGNTDGDGAGDACDTDDDNDAVDDIDDPFPFDVRYAADSDADGLPDEWEQDFGLDPNDAIDAGGDLDGDGRSNRNEFAGGFDPTVDDAAPVLETVVDFTIDATGPFTPLALQPVSAIDGKDGDLSATPDRTGPFRPGVNIVTWTASDAAGNTVSAEQAIRVRPLVGFGRRRLFAAEGTDVAVDLVLNGDAIDYPVTVTVASSGSATEGSDYILASTGVEIDGANAATLHFSVLDDGPGEAAETVALTIASADNAVIEPVAFELVIVEDNLPPVVTAELQQGGLPVATVTQDGGMAQALLSASDPNPGDTVTAAWGRFPGSPTPEEGFGLPTFTFDPALTETGAYQLRGRASDDGTPAEETTRDQVVRVIATAPALAEGVDSDGDGFADADEGLLDLNGNGVSDWLDPSTYRHHVPARTGGSALLQVAAGYQLSLGQPAAATGEDALVSITDIAEHADSGGPVDNAADPAFSYPGGIFDVTISGLAEPGEFVALVLPQMAPVPEGATLRLYSSNSGWEDANLVAENEVYSVPGAPGACPAPDSPLYTSGLTAGDHCVQVRLQDNGANDADLTPRLFRFTGGVTSARTPPAIAASAVALADADAAAGSRDVPLLAFRLDSNSSDVRLDGLTLAASGSGDDASDIATVRVWHDLNANGQVDGADGEVGTGTFASDDGTLEIRFATPLVLDAGVTDFIVSYDFQESGND